jgi:hypothetical protein
MEQIEAYVKEIEAAQAKEWAEHKYDMAKVPIFAIEKGNKYARITRRSYGQLSVHCFVEMSTGDIYKAATWKAPAKGVRGNINSEKKPLLGYDFYNKY